MFLDVGFFLEVRKGRKECETKKKEGNKDEEMNSGKTAAEISAKAES